MHTTSRLIGAIIATAIVSSIFSGVLVLAVQGHKPAIVFAVPLGVFGAIAALAWAVYLVDQ